jgi:hypothetical protein
MTSSNIFELGELLDQDHLPETNGRMAICRRCGSTTDGLAGFHHTPREIEVARCSRWLDRQARLTHLEQVVGADVVGACFPTLDVVTVVRRRRVRCHGSPYR